MAIDRLGSRKMRSETIPMPTRNGSTPFLNSLTWSPFLAASIAHQMTMARRAISEG